MEKDNWEQLCIGCAMFHNVMEEQGILFRHARMPDLEDMARWLEQQDLLKHAGMRIPGQNSAYNCACGMILLRA
jgi:hypothetical protein